MEGKIVGDQIRNPYIYLWVIYIYIYIYIEREREREREREKSKSYNHRKYKILLRITNRIFKGHNFCASRSLHNEDV